MSKVMQTLIKCGVDPVTAAKVSIVLEREKNGETNPDDRTPEEKALIKKSTVQIASVFWTTFIENISE